MNVSKNMLWLTVSSTIVAVVNIIVHSILSLIKIINMRTFFYFYIFFYLITVWLPFLLQYFFKIEFSLTFLICYQIFLFLGICVGTIWDVYSMGFGFDKMVHTFGGVVLALLAYSIFSNFTENKLTLFWLFILIFSISMMLGGVWEILEYIIDDIFDNNAQRYFELVGHAALADTMVDMVCDFVGGIIGATFAVFSEKKKRAVGTQKEIIGTPKM